MSDTASELEISGKRLKLTNLSKVFYPKVGFTKAQVIDYYIRISPVLLPHLKDRPLTLKRYPNGVEGSFFYEKACPVHRPAWVKTAAVYSHGRGEDIQFCLCNDLPTLVWAANLADLELHTPMHLARAVDRPTMVVFDLDPGAPAGIVQCCRVALQLRAWFAEMELQSFAKTSGSKGLQIYVPLNTPHSYEQTKGFAKAIAQRFEAERPREVVSSMKKALRVGKVLIDWSQNDEHKTTVCVYSLRAKEQPTVSTPIHWDEVQACADAEAPELLTFTADDAVARAAAQGDLFAPVLKLRQKLPLGG